MHSIPLLLLKYGKPIEDLYIDLETDLINNISGRLHDTGNMPDDTAMWKIRKLTELGQVTSSTMDIITKKTKLLPGLTRVALQSAVLESTKYMESAFADAVKKGLLSPAPNIAMSDRMLRVFDTYVSQATERWNLTNTTMLKKSQEAYVRIINRTSFEAVSGISSRQEALKKTIHEFVDKGIPAFVDKSGREWSPEAYSNMVIRTTTSNTAHAAQTARMEDYGLDVIEVSSHSGARPGCEPYQGKFYSMSNKSGYIKDADGKRIKYEPISTTTYGKPGGLFGINCGHQRYPVIPGMFYRTYYPTEDKAENDRIYKESQQQRAIERAIRKAKREAEALRLAGADDTEAKLKIKAQQQRMRNFIDKTGRTRRPDRERIYN